MPQVKQLKWTPPGDSNKPSPATAAKPNSHSGAAIPDTAKPNGHPAANKNAESQQRLRYKLRHHGAVDRPSFG